MAGSGRSDREGLSRGELNRRRLQAQFVGRRAQLSLFAENLGKDPRSETDPAEYLFHVRGVGGIGKSTLLRQWQETARSAGAVTAVVDENDVHGVQQALTELARQLAEQAGTLKEFDRAAEQYRREQEEAATEPPPADGEPSLSSRVVTQAVVGAAASLVPGGGALATMANPDAAAQGLDRLRAGARNRGRRGRGGDATEVSRAFLSELRRLSGRYRWVVLFFDTWEETDRYLDGWLRDLLDEVFGPLPVNVIVVLAGRDPLAEREWAPLRPLVVDVPLEVFTEAETRALLAARGVTEPDVVEAVLQLSMGLPLLVGLLARARPVDAEDVDADGDVVDTAVKRFVQWIKDERQRDTVLACALAPQLNEDVFTAAAPPEARELWGWLCEQPFVSGRGDFKQYHAVVRASMVRRQRLHSPQGWTTAHDRLADAHAGWRTEAEEGIPEAKRWDDPRWRRHRLDETYHRLCAHPASQLPAALEEAVHAAAQDTAILRQWTDSLSQAARDTADPVLLTWAERLQGAVTGEGPMLAALTALLTHGGLNTSVRAWAHTYLGRELYLADRDEESIAELDRAIALDPHNTRALAFRGETRRWLGHLDQAIADFTAALAIDPEYAWALGSRGQAHRRAGRHEEAITDLDTALDLNPTLDWALAERGETHRLSGRIEEAVRDLTTALELDPASSWALSCRAQAHQQAGRYDEAVTDLTAALELNPPAPDWTLGLRGEVQRQAGRFGEAVADFTAALELDPTDASPLAQRGQTHRQAGRYDEAVTDLTAALELDPDLVWALAQRGEAHRLAGRYDEAITDFTTALDHDPTLAWALGSRGQAHQQAGRYDEAITDLTAALELDPNLDVSLVERAESLRLAGRYDEAVTDFTTALDRDPTDVWSLGSRGQAHRQAGRYDEAVTDLTAAIDLGPPLVWILAERGVAHEELGQYAEAVTDLTAALELDPEYAWALARRGEVHRLTGRFRAAVTDLTAALELAPANAWALTRRGEVHRQAGRYDEAVADFTTALDIDPGYTWALTQRGVAHREAGRHAQAREDLERAVAAEPGNHSLLFEKLMLDTVTTGFTECAEQWAELFAVLTEASEGAETRLLVLFRMLFLEPEGDLTAATEAFLAENPDHDTVTDALHYLVELSAMADEPAERAGRCRQLVWEHLEFSGRSPDGA